MLPIELFLGFTLIACQHDQAVDDSEGALTCEDCGEELEDPWWVGGRGSVDETFDADQSDPCD